MCKAGRDGEQGRLCPAVEFGEGKEKIRFPLTKASSTAGSWKQKIAGVWCHLIGAGEVLRCLASLEQSVGGDLQKREKKVSYTRVVCEE